MKNYILTNRQIVSFRRHLKQEEREQSTIEKYVRDVRLFEAWLSGRRVTAEIVTDWKDYLRTKGYKPETINAKLSALNKFFVFMRWLECRIKYLKIQKRLFRGTEKELTKGDYVRLLETADTLRKNRLALLIETICATGIRVSEVRYITMEAVRAGYADVALKGKIRTILLPAKLCRKLQKYARKQKIASGEIFITRTGKGVSRRQIWAEMKALCKKAGVAASKVFPHNLRHLFARTFYRACRDVAKLADVLGHSSIETTRIYLISTGKEHTRQLERLGLIL
ncbi:MAG: tyrosine-type recombinase/integrase [Oscillospiraceae bacterium]|jgi:integrase/recombinase XerD|nr:tyrosine-type recombinase/integrase [Oscillospiraceae bacterium]